MESLQSYCQVHVNRFAEPVIINQALCEMPQSKSADRLEIPEHIFKAEDALWNLRRLPDNLQDSIRQNDEQMLKIAEMLSTYREYFTERLGGVNLANERFKGLCEAAVRSQTNPISQESGTADGNEESQRDPPRWGNSQTNEEEPGEGLPSYEQALEDAVHEAEGETTNSVSMDPQEPSLSLSSSSSPSSLPPPQEPPQSSSVVRQQPASMPTAPAEQEVIYGEDVPDWLRKMLQDEARAEMEGDMKFASEIQRQNIQEHGLSDDADVNLLVSRWTIEERTAQMEDDLRYAAKLQQQLEDEMLPSKEERQAQEDRDAAFAAQLQREAEEADREAERQRTKQDAEFAAQMVLEHGPQNGGGMIARGKSKQGGEGNEIDEESSEEISDSEDKESNERTT